MRSKGIESVITNIVKRFENDISGRQGIGDLFDRCDKDVREEIRNDWKEILRDEIPATHEEES